MDRPYNRPYYDYDYEYPTISPPRSWSSYTSADSQDSLDEDGYPIDRRERRIAGGTRVPGNYSHGRRDQSDTSAPSSPESRRRDKQPAQRRGPAEEKVEEKESMTSWLGRITGTREAQLAATAVVSGAVVASAIFGYQNVRRRERVGELKADIPDLNDVSEGHKVGMVRQSTIQ